MHIEKLKLKNFRGASDLTFDLDPRLNVFVGLNGSGKSTTLDAVAILLSWLANRISSASASGRPLTEHDIRNGNNFGSLTILLKLGETDSLLRVWSIAKSVRGAVPLKYKTSLGHARALAAQFRDQLAEDANSASIPLLVYYPVNRAVTDIPLRIKKKHVFDLLSAYEDSLTSAANFRTFFEWFREREDIENEALRDASLLANGRRRYKPDPQLDAVRKALVQFMPDFSDFAIRRNPLRMEVKKRGETLIVNQLSDGEKCLMAMIGDLARRMAIANPTAKKPLAGAGVVLIDEIDLHLHPKWQREIVPRLLATFPNCQFLISTHSPHVITHVHPGNLHLLSHTKKGLKSAKPTESYGKNADRVLEDLMGLATTRPDKVQGDLNQIYDYIQEGELSEAMGAIQELKQAIGDDPALVHASVLLRRKGLINK